MVLRLNPDTGILDLTGAAGGGTGGGLEWNEEAGTSVALESGNGYILSSASLVTVTLPLTAGFGDTIEILGKGTGLFTIAQNAGQTVHFLSIDSTTGVTGSFTSKIQYSAIELICITDDTDWMVANSAGSFTPV